MDSSTFLNIDICAAVSLYHFVYHNHSKTQLESPPTLQLHSPTSHTICYPPLYAAHTMRVHDGGPAIHY